MRHGTECDQHISHRPQVQPTCVFARLPARRGSLVSIERHCSFCSTVAGLARSARGSWRGLLCIGLNSGSPSADSEVLPDRGRSTRSGCPLPQPANCFQRRGEGYRHPLPQSGRVKLAATSPQGKEAIVRLVAPGDFFGYQVLDGHRTRLATATAMTESSVLRIDGAVMSRLLREDPVFSTAFVGHLVQQLVSVEETLVDHLNNLSEKRLARVLLRPGRTPQKGQPGTLVVPSVTHEVLAQMVGTTRARVPTCLR